jgi:nucleotide-binding universal stress UspA family protein
VSDAGELAGEEEYVRERARLFAARVKFVIAPDPGTAILEELHKSPRAVPAMTSHGHSGWLEAVIGSVALKVLRGAARPVIVCRPSAAGIEMPHKVDTVITALDGGAFSEKIIPFAVEFARSVSARLTLVQALPLRSEMSVGSRPATDISESAYLQSRAADIKKKYGVEASWDTLHGEPAQAICRFVHGSSNTMLALTSHARGGLEKVFLGSVAAKCLRHAGVPLLVYWPAGSS